MKVFRFAAIMPLSVIVVVVTTIFMLQSLGSELLFGLGDWPKHAMLFLTPLLIIIVVVYHSLYIHRKRN